MCVYIVFLMFPSCKGILTYFVVFFKFQLLLVSVIINIVATKVLVNVSLHGCLISLENFSYIFTSK